MFINDEIKDGKSDLIASSFSFYFSLLNNARGDGDGNKNEGHVSFGLGTD